jgi:hypothetical protein
MLSVRSSRGPTERRALRTGANREKRSREANASKLRPEVSLRSVSPRYSATVIVQSAGAAGTLVAASRTVS